MIRELSKKEPLHLLCWLLGVARSGYYAWLERKESARTARNRLLLEQIREAFRDHRSNYGSPRITQVLHAQGQCNRKRVDRLMRQDGIKGRSGKQRRVRTTDSEHDQPIAPNLLRNRPAPSRADEVWVADITYVPTAQGWLFLAEQPPDSGMVVVGKSGGRWSAAGAGQSFDQARQSTGCYPPLRSGVQYASALYREQLQRNGLIASMSRKGNCYDNAAMEAFWSTLKREALHQSDHWSKDRTRRETFQYIKAEYNRRRLHSSLGYKSPVDFEQTNN